MNGRSLRICATHPRFRIAPANRTLNVASKAYIHKLLALVALMFALLLTSTRAADFQQRPSNEATVLVAEARSLWKHGEQERALTIILKAVSLDPQNPATHVQLALIRMALKDNNKARSALDDALRIDNNYAPAHQALGAILRRSGDFEGAIREAKLALSLHPDAETGANSHETLGLTYQALKRTDDAIAEFREATRSNPTDGSNYAFLGTSLYALGKDDEAEAAFRRAIELDPHSYLDLGAALLSQGRTEEATGFYQQYLKVDPKAANRVDVELWIWRLQHTPLPQLLGGLLLEAARKGNVASVKSLLAKGADINFRDNNYATPLSEAARAGLADVVKMLLARGAKDEYGTAAGNAYENGHPETEKLLEQAEPRPRSPKVLNHLLYSAVRNRDIPRVEALLAEGADDRSGALFEAVNTSKPDMRLVELLLAKGASSNSSALIPASGNGNVEIVKLLLAKGADVKVKWGEDTALTKAVQAGNTEIVKLLLDAGSDVNAKGRSGYTALSLAAGPTTSEMNQSQGTPAKVNTEILQLLLARGADVNAKTEYGETVLMRANSVEKVKMLLARGADVNAKDKYDQTALLKAAELGNVEVVDALLKGRADSNAKDTSGSTALLQSLQYDHVKKSAKDYIEIARLLLSAKNINVNAQNRYGETALMRAVNLSNVNIVKLLLDRGADVNLADEAGSTAFVKAYAEGNAEIDMLLQSRGPHRQTHKELNAFLSAAIGKRDAARVKALLSKGADPNHIFSLGYGLEGTTNNVLVLAAAVGDARIVQMLLDKGADINAKGFITGNESRIETGTALEAAERAGHVDVVSLLKKAYGTTPATDYMTSGNALMAKGDLDRAIADYNKAIEIKPLDPVAYINRGIARMAKGDLDGAITDYNKAIEIKPLDPVAYLYRGHARKAKGDPAGAITDYNKAIGINPRDAQAYNGLAWLLATSSRDSIRDGKRAIENARKASELTKWEDPFILDTLAAAYAEVGNFEEAIKWENKALSFTDFAKSTGEEARRHLQLYMQRKPYREY